MNCRQVYLLFTTYSLWLLLLLLGVWQVTAWNEQVTSIQKMEDLFFHPNDWFITMIEETQGDITYHILRSRRFSPVSPVELEASQCMNVNSSDCFTLYQVCFKRKFFFWERQTNRLGRNGP